jgi:hypothetical protein
MPFPQAGPCNVPLDTIIGTGFNTVAVPDEPGAQYKSVTEQLLYEIWQGILLLLAATNPPGMVVPITFTIGDGQAGTPANGTTALSAPAIQGQSIVNKTLLVVREGIVLMYSDATTARQIIRINTVGGDGGFSFDPASGLTFQTGESYEILTIGTNTATT